MHNAYYTLYLYVATFRHVNTRDAVLYLHSSLSASRCGSILIYLISRVLSARAREHSPLTRATAKEYCVSDKIAFPRDARK